MAEWIDLSNHEIDQHVLKSIPAAVACENLAVPVRFKGDTLIVAVADPDQCSNQIDKLRFILNCDVEAVGASLIDIKFAIWRYYGPPSSLL